MVMSKIPLVVLLYSVCSLAMANEMFYATPTDYVISGADVGGGESAYSITAKVASDDEGSFFESLDIRIYDRSVSVGKELLEQARDPNLMGLRVVNDFGVFGSDFYIHIPFGERGKCREARQKDLHKEIYVSSLGAADGDKLTARIVDPCD